MHCIRVLTGYGATADHLAMKEMQVATCAGAHGCAAKPEHIRSRSPCTGDEYRAQDSSEASCASRTSQHISAIASLDAHLVDSIAAYANLVGLDSHSVALRDLADQFFVGRVREDARKSEFCYHGDLPARWYVLYRLPIADRRPCKSNAAEEVHGEEEKY